MNVNVSIAHKLAVVALGALGAALLAALVLGPQAASAGKPANSTYTPTTPSQLVDCNLVDQRLSQLPNAFPTQEGPGGWRYSSSGQSFVTFEHELVGPAYAVNAGRSNIANPPNDYPDNLTLPQAPDSDVLQFDGRHGQIVLSGGTGFALPGEGQGQIIINVSDPEGDGTYEGCAKTPLLENFGFVRPEGGTFVQQDLFKAYAETAPDGTVTFYEWTEVSTFKDTAS